MDDDDQENEHSGSDLSDSDDDDDDDLPDDWYHYLIVRKKLVQNWIFIFGINLAIGVNTVIIGFETDLSCGMQATSHCPKSETLPWELAEYLFLSIFCFEAVVKIMSFSWRGYISDISNKFDFILIFISFFDIVVSQIVLASGDGSPSLRALLALRVLRAFRVVRLVKLLRQFKELYVLIEALKEGWRSLIWVVCFIFLALYIMGVVFTILIGQNNDPSFDYSIQSTWSKSDYWGSVDKSMFTLFQFMTGDHFLSRIPGLPDQPTAVKTDPIIMFTLLLFLFVMTFGALNIMLGIVCENALYVSSKNQSQLDALEQKQQKSVIEAVTQIFEAADSDNSGELSRLEFDEALTTISVQKKLKVIDVSPDDLSFLYDIIDQDKSGSINLAEFRNGCLRMRGSARSRELVKLAVQVSCYNRNLDDLSDALDEQNNMLRLIYNQMYDIEKLHFRPRKADREAELNNPFSLRARQMRKKLQNRVITPLNLSDDEGGDYNRNSMALLKGSSSRGTSYYGGGTATQSQSMEKAFSQHVSEQVYQKSAPGFGSSQSNQYSQQQSGGPSVAKGRVNKGLISNLNASGTNYGGNLKDIMTPGSQPQDPPPPQPTQKQYSKMSFTQLNKVRQKSLEMGVQNQKSISKGSTKSGGGGAGTGPTSVTFENLGISGKVDPLPPRPPRKSRMSILGTLASAEKHSMMERKDAEEEQKRRENERIKKESNIDQMVSNFDVKSAANRISQKIGRMSIIGGGESMGLGRASRNYSKDSRDSRSTVQTSPNISKDRTSEMSEQLQLPKKSQTQSGVIGGIISSVTSNSKFNFKKSVNGGLSQSEKDEDSENPAPRKSQRQSQYGTNNNMTVDNHNNSEGYGMKQEGSNFVKQDNRTTLHKAINTGGRALRKSIVGLNLGGGNQNAVTNFNNNKSGRNSTTDFDADEDDD